ncbi:MAG: histidine kinase dimerization/phosphoacceptor domain -containing protein [Thermodesulfobacteriota bacterium]
MDETAAGGTAARILVVEDETVLSRDVGQILTTLGYELTGTASTGEQAVLLAQEAPPDLVLMNIRLAGEMDGIEAADRIHARLDIPVVYLTGYAERAIRDRAKKTDPYGYLRKPVTPAELRTCIEIALYRHEADKRLRQSEEKYRALCQETSDGVLLTEAAGTILDANPKALEMFGYSIEEIRGLNVLDLVDPAELAQTPPNPDRLISSRSPVAERRVRRKDGTVFFSEVSTNLVGENLAQVVHRDTTARRRQEEIARIQRELSIALSATSDLNEAFRLCVGAALQISGADAASICVVRDDAGFSLAYGEGATASFANHAASLEPKSREAGMLMQGVPVYSEDQFHEVSEAVRSALQEQGFHAAAAIPIQVGDRVVAGLHVSWRRACRIPPLARLALETIAGWVGSSILRLSGEDALRKTNETLDVLINATSDTVGLVDRDMRVLRANRANRAAAARYGMDVEQFTGRFSSESLPEDLARSRKRKLDEVFDSGLPVRFSDVWSDTHFDHCLHPVKGADGRVEAVAVFSRDITERELAELRIEASLREKEVLLREIHHRVKNNLAVIHSIVRLQSSYTADSELKDMFEDLQARIRSMALAHELLYQSEDLARIDLSKYIDKLVDSLAGSAALIGRGVTIRKDLHEGPIRLDTAIPAGFLVTELVSNCLKHAFPDDREGEITVSLRSRGDDELLLVVKDNGVGIPKDVDVDDPKTLGLDLVHTFVRQLHGHVEILSDAGTEVRVGFKAEKDRR